MKIAKTILTLLLSGYIIIAMGGFSIFHHLCTCSAQPLLTSSIFVEESCCSSSASNQTSCHAGSKTSCCDNTETEQCSCETEVDVLSTDETPIAKHIKLSTTHTILLATLLFNNLTQTEDGQEQKLFTENFSPPTSGKYIVILNHSLKIAHQIS